MNLQELTVITAARGLDEGVTATPGAGAKPIAPAPGGQNSGAEPGQEPTDLSWAAQANHSAVEVGETVEHPGARSPREPPDVAEELPLHSVIAPGDVLSTTQKPAQHPPHTAAAIHIQEDDQIRALQAHRHRAGVVAVMQPTFLSDQFADPTVPFLIRWLDPTGLPEVMIQMHQRKLIALRELTRDSRLSRT